MRFLELISLEKAILPGSCSHNDSAVDSRLSLVDIERNSHCFCLINVNQDRLVLARFTIATFAINHINRPLFQT